MAKKKKKIFTFPNIGVEYTLEIANVLASPTLVISNVWSNPTLVYVIFFFNILLLLLFNWVRLYSLD
jgi:hypothetical protein